MSTETLTFNGIDGTTGDYLLTLRPAEIAALWQGETVDPQHLQDLRERDRRAKEKVFAPMPGVDTSDLAQAGWAVIFPYDSDPAIESALTPLIEHRREQASKTDARRFKIFRGVDGYQPDEKPLDFLTRHGAGYGLADLTNSPFTSCSWAIQRRSRSRFSTSSTCSGPSVGLPSTPWRSTRATRPGWLRRNRRVHGLARRRSSVFATRTIRRRS